MKLTDERDHELHPSWSPDGRQLIYCKLGSKSGRWEMWVVDTQNPGVRRFLENVRARHLEERGRAG